LIFNHFSIIDYNCHLSKGSITLAFWMCSLNVRFTVECVFDVIFSVDITQDIVAYQRESRRKIADEIRNIYLITDVIV
jgi:hypothetical protein